MSILHKFPPAVQQLKLSFGIEKCLLEELSALGTFEQEQFINAVFNAYSKVYAHTFITDNLTQVVERVTARISKSSEPAPQGNATKKQAKTLGSSFADWLSGMDGSDACLFLADYDTEKALHFYWQEDLELVQEAIRIKSENCSQNILSNFEACFMGAGGKYTDSAANTIDVGTPEGAAALKQFGF